MVPTPSVPTPQAEPLGRLSIRAYGRVRKDLGLPGSSHPAVRKAMERLGFERGDDGLIDADALHAAWEAERGAEATPEGGNPEVGTAADEAPVTTPADDVPFAEARRRKELALAQLREMEVAEREGQLIPLEVHEERVQALCDRLAARVKGLGKYLGDVQRAMTDVESAALLERISDELLRALLGLADEDEEDDDGGDGAVAA